MRLELIAVERLDRERQFGLPAVEAPVPGQAQIDPVGRRQYPDVTVVVLSQVIPLRPNHISARSYPLAAAASRPAYCWGAGG